MLVTGLKACTAGTPGSALQGNARRWLKGRKLEWLQGTTPHSVHEQK